MSRDRGASSLRDNSQFQLYVRSTRHNIVQRLRKISQTSVVSKYEKHYDEEANIGECSRNINNDDYETYDNMQNRTFRKISVSKRKRRGKNSVSGFTKLHDLEEVPENEGGDNEAVSYTHLTLPTIHLV